MSNVRNAMWLVIITTIGCCITAPSHADVIDFNGLTSGDPIRNIDTATNRVTFSCGATHNTAGDCLVGGSNRPSPALANEAFNPGNPPFDQDVFMVFDNPIRSLSLDLIDLERPDGSVTLTLFSDANFTNIIDATTVLPLQNPPNAVVQPMFVSADGTGQQAHAARLSITLFGRDAVVFDNFDFATVPEPSSVFVLGIMASCMLARRRQMA